MTWGMLTLLGRFEYRACMGGAYGQNLTYADLLGGPVYTITEQTLANSQMMMAVGLRAKTETLGFDLRISAQRRQQPHSIPHLPGRHQTGLLMPLDARPEAGRIAAGITWRGSNRWVSCMSGRI